MMATKTDAKPCACPEPEWVWVIDDDHRAVCREAGWQCFCGGKPPGDPAGYSPWLDRSEIRTKVSVVLMVMHASGLIYMSNNDHGDNVIAHVAHHCQESGCFDQYTIIAEIMRQINATHAKRWKEIGSGVITGNDPRERCHCGKLATSFTVGVTVGVKGGKCSEHWDWSALRAQSPEDN